MSREFPIAGCHVLVNRRGTETGPRAHDARGWTRDRTRGRSASDGPHCLARERLAVSVILARGLGPAEFGIYGVIISVLTWTQLLLGGGVQAPRRSSSPSSRNGRLRSSRRHAPCWSRPASPSLPEAGSRRRRWRGCSGFPSAAYVLRVALLDLPLMAAYFALQGALYGRAHFGTLALGLVVHSLLKLAGVALLAILGLSVTGAILAQVAASIGVLGFLFSVVPPPRTMPAPELARPMLMMALPLSLYAMALQIHVNLGLWLLSASDTASAAIGFFVAALTVSRTLSIVQSVLSGVVFASMSRALARRDEATARLHLKEGAFRASADCSRGGAPERRCRSGGHAPVRRGLRPAGNILRWQLIAFAILPLLDLCFTALAADGPPAYPAWLLAALIAPAVGLCLALVDSHGGGALLRGPGDRRGDRNWPRSFGHVAAVSDAPGALPCGSAARPL